MTSRDLPGGADAPRRRGWWSSDRFQRPAFMLPTVVVLLCLTLYPFIYSVYLSLHFVRLTTLHRKVWAGLQNYYDLFANELFLQALANTAMLAVTTITLEIVLGFIAAKVFFELAHKRWINTLRSAFLVPMMVTPIITSVARLMPSTSDSRQPYRLSNLDLVTESLTLMAWNFSSPRLCIW